MCMHNLTKDRRSIGWQYAVVKLLMQGLAAFLLLFNSSWDAWDIDRSNLLWVVVRWVLPRSPVSRVLGYNTYLAIFYAIVAVVAVLLLLVAWLTQLMRKDESSKRLRKLVGPIALVVDFFFCVAYLPVIDFILFNFDCSWVGSGPKLHNIFPSIDCAAMPHLAHAAVAGVFAVLFILGAFAMAAASADLNPLAGALVSSPAAPLRIKVLAALFLSTIVNSVLLAWPTLQTSLIVGCTALVVWYETTQVMYYRTATNVVSVAMFNGVLYTACLLAATTVLYPGREAAGDLGFRRRMTLAVLYGIWPAMLLGGALPLAWLKWLKWRGG